MSVAVITSVDTVESTTVTIVEFRTTGDGANVAYAVTRSVMEVGLISNLVDVMYVVVGEAALAVHLHLPNFVVAPRKATDDAVRLSKSMAVLVALAVTEMVEVWVAVVVHATFVVLGAIRVVKVEFE